MAAVDGFMAGGEDGPVRKKPKISELPLSSIKRASIDGLLHVFKKKGEFDALRKKTYKQFEDGVGYVELVICLSYTNQSAGFEVKSAGVFASLHRWRD